MVGRIERPVRFRQIGGTFGHETLELSSMVRQFLFDMILFRHVGDVGCRAGITTIRSQVRTRGDPRADLLAITMPTEYFILSQSPPLLPPPPPHTLSHAVLAMQSRVGPEGRQQYTRALRQPLD